MDFIRRNIKKILFSIIVLMLVMLIGISSSNSMQSHNLGFFGNIITSLQKVTSTSGNTISSSIYSIQEIVKMREENNLLQENVYELLEQIRILENIVNKSEALKTEYEMKKSLTYDYVIGQVIALDGTNWFNRFVIDKGTKDDIRKNDIVIHGVKTKNGLVQIGLVGLVTDTSDHSSKIITLLDENCKVSFRNINSDESGILQGSIDSVTSGYFFNSKALSEVGDLVVTSGIGEVYLKDIYIGLVKEVLQTTDASNKKIVVEPAVEFTKLNRVFVLKVNR